MRRLRESLRGLLRVEGTPHRIALAFGIGTFIAFSPVPPLFGFHTVIGLAIAFALRLDRVAMVAGVWVNNPATIPFSYLGGTLLGCLLMGLPLEGPAMGWSTAGLSGLVTEIRPYVWPFVVGNTVLALACGAVAYLALRWVIERRRALRAGTGGVVAPR